MEIAEKVLGMAQEVTVSKEEGMDFALLIMQLTRDERVIGEKLVHLSHTGMSLTSMKTDLLGKYVLTETDKSGRGTTPIRGSLEWSNLRNVYVAPLSGGTPLCVRVTTDKKTWETVHVKNSVDRRKYVLPMPTKGWNMEFVAHKGNDGVTRKFITEGEKEED